MVYTVPVKPTSTRFVLSTDSCTPLNIEPSASRKFTDQPPTPRILIKALPPVPKLVSSAITPVALIVRRATPTPVRATPLVSLNPDRQATTNRPWLSTASCALLSVPLAKSSVKGLPSTLPLPSKQFSTMSPVLPLTASTIWPEGSTNTSLAAPAWPFVLTLGSGEPSGSRRVSTGLVPNCASTSCRPCASSASATGWYPVTVSGVTPARLTANEGAVSGTCSRSDAKAVLAPKALAVLATVSTAAWPLTWPPWRSQAVKLIASASVPLLPSGWKYSRVLASATSKRALAGVTAPTFCQPSPPLVLNQTVPLLLLPTSAMPGPSPGSASLKALPSRLLTSRLPAVLPLTGAAVAVLSMSGSWNGPAASTGALLMRTVRLTVSAAAEKVTIRLTMARPLFEPLAPTPSATTTWPLASTATPVALPAVSALAFSTGAAGLLTSSADTPPAPLATHSVLPTSCSPWAVVPARPSTVVFSVASTTGVFGDDTSHTVRPLAPQAR